MDTSHYWLDRNMHIIRTPGYRDVATVQPQPVFENLPVRKQAHPQNQSPFFALLPREIRNDIYAYVLTTQSSSEYFLEGAACECVPCEYRRWEDSRGGIFCRSAPTQARNTLHRPGMNWIVKFFKTCRRMYDESRPVLQETNEFWFDGKVKKMPILRKISKALSCHRGLPLPAPVLVSATFVISFQFDSVTYHQHITQGFYAAISSSLRDKQLQIRHLTVVIGLQSDHVIFEFVPLLRALELLRGVQTCKIVFKIPSGDEWSGENAAIERQALISMKKELEAAALCDPSALATIERSAKDHFIHARLLCDESSKLLCTHGNIEHFETKKWDQGYYDAPDVKHLEEHYGFGEFLASYRARSDINSDLDPRAIPFFLGAMAYQTREALTYEI